MKKEIAKIGRFLLLSSLLLNVTSLILFLGDNLSLLSEIDVGLWILISIPIDLFLFPLFLFLAIIFWLTKATSEDWNLLLFNIVIIIFYIWGLLFSQATSTYG